MNSFQRESCYTIANHYGKKSQMLISIEEMSELTKEICKYERYENNEQKIIDEIADVEIMIEQLKCLFDVHSEVDERIDYKLRRQLRRIEHERGE